MSPVSDRPPNPWQALECLPGLSALPHVWEAMLGDYLQPFKILCLQDAPTPVHTIPCPKSCGCFHSIIHRHDPSGAIAICRCEPPTCPDIPVTLQQVTPLEINRNRLARALATALGCRITFAKLRPRETFQFGAWSTQSVPAILTIQAETNAFQATIAELVARLRRPFILLAPTAIHLTATCQELMANADAIFLAIDTTMILSHDGGLRSRQTPGELLAKVTPQPKQTDEDAAIRAFALISQFDHDTLAVFRLYCVDALSAAQVAARLGSSKTRIMHHLNLIRQKTGTAPAELRRLSPHIAKIQSQTSDPRASHIKPTNLIYDHFESDNQQD